MERRLILAIALSLLILLSWSAWVSKTQPIVNKGVTKGIPPAASTVVKPEPVQVALSEPPPSSLLKFSQDKTEIIFVESQASIKEVVFKDYRAGKIILGNGFLFGAADLSFRKESFGSGKAIFSHKDQDKEIIKRFIFSQNNYNLILEIEIRNMSNLNLQVNWPLVLGTLHFRGDPNEVRYQGAAIITKEKTFYLNGRKDARVEGIEFLSLRNRYFCAIVEPEERFIAGVQNISQQESQVYLQSPEINLAPGQTITEKFRIYLGPQDLHTINSIQPAWTVVMHYGTFNFIAQGLLRLLGFIHRLVPNWGGVIIIVSILIYLLLYPLTLKQMRSMKEMQALQPRIEELRKAHKDNPQRLNKEIMELYREHKVNPFGGCLPLILQIPIFFALYQVLMRSVALTGAKFLWIKDLSQPDRLFLLPVSLPALGNEINILPIVMAIGMFVQQKLSLSSAASSTSAEQQKFMMIFFPIMFGLIFYKMPAGLVLYWLINSSLMLLYQWRISRAK